MTHEFETILNAYYSRQSKAVMATLVDVSGSSYRGPDARMLVFEDGSMTGALSGGCVEKEIRRQSAGVFLEGTPLMMVYDGRYRLGCEGVLRILLEPFAPPEDLLPAFKKHLPSRNPIEIKTYHPGRTGPAPKAGSILHLTAGQFPFQTHAELEQNAACLHTTMNPKFRLLVFGGEHDTIPLSRAALDLGWETWIIHPPEVALSRENYPEGTQFLSAAPGHVPLPIDGFTAVVLMSHNYARDLQGLCTLADTFPCYVGLLGPGKRREKLMHDLFERKPDIATAFLDLIHGPAGLNLGAVTPEEIALSIVAEILAVSREKKPIPLKEKMGRIHQ